MRGAASGKRARALLPALRAGLAPIAILLLGACATVEPWERGRLSHPAMEEGREPEADNMAQHEAGAREGALGPGASGGGVAVAAPDRRRRALLIAVLLTTPAPECRARPYDAAALTRDEHFREAARRVLGRGKRGLNERDGQPNTHGGVSHLSAGDFDALVGFVETL